MGPPPGAGRRVFAATALHHGVAVGPGPIFSFDMSGFEDHLQLSFAPPADVLIEAVDRLHAAWADWRE